MIEEILPLEAVGAEAFGDPPGLTLCPEEEALVARAVYKRRRELTTARTCARTALAMIGVASAPIPSCEQGSPQWPSGVVGSITHCAGYRAAATARAKDVLTIGLDAEPDEVLPSGVLEAVSLPDERERLRSLTAAAPGACWDRLLFSAKETTYKAWFPLTRCWLGFEDADITINAADGTFEARLLVPAPTVSGSPLLGFTGRWLARDGLLLTAITALT